MKSRDGLKVRGEGRRDESGSIIIMKAQGTDRRGEQ